MASRVETTDVDLYRGVVTGILKELASKDVMRVTLKVLNRARVLAPVDTGNLRASHQMRLTQGTGSIQGEVSTKVKYALPLHEGRKRTTIYPTNKQALAFVWHGQKMVRKSVTQPARRGRPWLRDALREVATAEGYEMDSTPAG